MNNIENNFNLDKSLLILDDDDVFRNRLITAMKRKGYEAYGAASPSLSTSGNARAGAGT